MSADEVERAVTDLRRLLLMVQSATPRTYTPEALERAGFKPRDDTLIEHPRIAGRRILAWIEEREARRRVRRESVGQKGRRAK